MTFDDFKAIVEHEFPHIENMVEPVKKLGAYRINVSVNREGHIDFNINMKKGNLYFSAWRPAGRKAGEATVCMMDTSVDNHWRILKESKVGYCKEEGKNEG